MLHGGRADSHRFRWLPCFQRAGPRASVDQRMTPPETASFVLGLRRQYDFSIVITRRFRQRRDDGRVLDRRSADEGRHIVL